MLTLPSAAIPTCGQVPSRRVNIITMETWPVIGRRYGSAASQRGHAVSSSVEYHTPRGGGLPGR